MKKLITLFFVGVQVFAQTPAKRSIKPSDVYNIQTVSGPEVSPDGKWLAYSLTTTDSVKNKRNSDVWIISWDGKENIQMTNSPDGESQAKFSPDGKYISFVSARNGMEKSQIFLLDRRGGEAKQMTTFKNDMGSYEWSPDGKKIVLTFKDAGDTSKNKTPKPIEIDRYRFKVDVQGYLQNRATHLYLYDVATKKLDTLTAGRFDEGSPRWSPDSKYIAFVSNQTEDPDRNTNSDIWIVEAKAKGTVRKLTTWEGGDYAPMWSPDGKSIAYLKSTSATYNMYDQAVLAVIPVTGGEPKLISDKLDRPVNSHQWTADGQNIVALIADDRERYVGQFSLKTGQLTKLASGQRSFSALEPHPNGSWITMVSDPTLAPEIYALENGQTRRLTKHHDEFFSKVNLANVEGFTSKSKDGTIVGGILYTPFGSTKKNLPLLLLIHGGPVSQDEYSFGLNGQVLAAAGYAVASVNYRGSNGKGIEFSKAIYADWGKKEVVDLHGAVDYLVEKGIADPNRLGTVGWSYGGILTNALIATDTRFKAAASGAGVSFQLAFYGVDQYILQNENELGLPWKSIDNYLKVSFPFLHADKIKTPTLFMVGEKDFNVPAAGSEQMYQALKSQNIPTQLIIYPGQFHGITVPSYQKDRLVRYIDWFKKYL
jgi:dipeptidyl aminopeptidase/acylaminoacyl peptidase